MSGFHTHPGLRAQRTEKASRLFGNAGDGEFSAADRPCQARIGRERPRRIDNKAGGHKSAKQNWHLEGASPLAGLKRLPVAITLFIACAFTLFAPSLAAYADDAIVVDASSDIQAALSRDLIPLFIKQTGILVNPTYDSSANLAKLLMNGAPVDVFLAGDDTTVKSLGAKGLLDPSTERAYAVGRLAVMLRPGLEGRQASVDDLSQTWVTRVELPDPAQCAYGKTAEDVLINADIYDTITMEQRLVLYGGPEDAFQAAETGDVDATVTALSLVIKVPKANYEIVPSRFYKPINETLGLPPNASADAKSFAAFLVSPPAQAILKQYGYLLPKSK